MADDKQPTEKKPSIVKKQADWLRPAMVGPHFAVCIAMGYVIGRQLDKWLGTYPYMIIAFSIFGVAAGFINLFKELQIVNEEEKERQAQEPTLSEQTPKPESATKTRNNTSSGDGTQP